MYRNKIVEYNVVNTPWPLEDNSVDCCVTSPPYWGLRDYGVTGQLGLEKMPEEFIERMVTVFEEVRRVLKPQGTLWLNIGDSYAGAPGGYQGKNGQRASRTFTAKIDHHKRGLDIKPKDLLGIPWMLAFALRSAGWYLRQDIIWSKPNPMPESVNDRCTKSHEYLFLLTKSRQYYYDQGAILEPMAAASAQRLNQDIEKQNGSDRGHGGQKHNGPMKACQPKGNRKTFRGGGKYTGSQSFNNTTLVDNDSIGNAANETGMRNKRSVWTVATQPFSEAHFATFPEELILPCVLAGSPKGGLILDPFMGAGTTALVAMSHGREFIGFELNPAYITIAEKRLKKKFGMFYQP